MDGAEGMVAIVQGSRHAGLTVTVLPERPKALKRRYYNQDGGVKTHTRVSKSNVETNTERIPKNSSIPICDIRYASSYQFANCLQSPLRANLYHKQPCYMDYFAQSLRSYPTSSNSAELIQRLLDYTQARNDKKSFLSKSKRTLLNKSTNHQTNRIIKKHGDEAKARAKIVTTSRKPLHHSVCTITKTCSSQEELLNYTYDYLKSTSLLPRKTEVRYLTEMKRALRERLREIIDNKPVTCPRIHSRYILHKRKYHDNTLNPVPMLPTNDVETEARFPRTLTDVPTLTRKISSKVKELHSGHKICVCEQPLSCVCVKDTYIDKVKDEEIKSLDDKEMQKILKEINEWVNNIPVYPNFNQLDKIKQEETINRLAWMLKKLKNDAHFNFKARKEIYKCLNALPMWRPSDLNDDILLKEQMADNLIEKLIRMAESNFREEIFKEIKKLPFHSVSIDSRDFESVVEKFIRKLKPLAVLDDKDYKKVLKTEIIKLFDDLSFKLNDRKDIDINGIAEKFAEHLCNIKLPVSSQNAAVLNDFREETEKILDWYKNISEFSKFDITKDKNLLYDLSRKINEHITRGLQRDDEQEQLQEEIENWLDKVAVKINGHLDTNTRKQLSNKLMQKFLTSNNNAVNAKIIGDNDRIENNFSQILGWFEDIPQLSGGNKNENRKAVQKLARQLQGIQSRDENFENRQINMKEMIFDWLQNIFKNNNKSIDLMTQENLVNQLVYKLNNLKQEKPQQNQAKNQNKELYTDLITWLKENYGIKFDTYFYENEIDTLISTLTEIENNSDKKSIEAKTKDAITNFTKTLSDKTGISFPFKQQELLEQKLFERMNIKPQQRKRWNREINQSLQTEELELGKELVTSTPKAYACNRFPSTLSNASPIRNLSLIDQALSENEEYIQYLSDIRDAIDRWINHFDFNISHTQRIDLVKDIATNVIDRHKYLQLSEHKTTKGNELEHLKYQIFRRFKNLNNHKALSEIISKVDDLNELVLNIKIPTLINQTHKMNRVEDLNFSKDIQNLVKSLKAWFSNNIPSDIQNVYSTINYDDFIPKFAKQLANLSENSHTDIYLKNDISQWLSKLFPKLDRHLLSNWVESLNKHLVDHDKKTEVTGSHYRKMLSDTMSQILPSLKDTSAADLLHLEHLKEKITDAFINLHYFTEDRNMLDKFKTKLIREVNHFCDEYLKHFPEAPLNTEEINKNLYNALKKVSVPNIESIRSDLEQVRLKEEITSWLQKVPLNKFEDADMQINQMVSTLAKRLHDIEKDKINLEPSNNKNSQMETEITNWLKNLPIKEHEILNLPVFANKLVEKLNATSKCRTLSISKIGKYDDSDTLFQIESTVAHYPRSTLSDEDRNHLSRIRKRLSYSSEENLIPTSKDASISPLPKNIGMQTEISKVEETIQTSRASLIEKSSLINRDISPQVIIREFYWDSNGSNQSLQLNIPTSPHKITTPSTGVSTTKRNTQTTASRITKEDDAQTVDIIQNVNNINQAVKSNTKISPQIIKGVDAQTDQILDRQRTLSTKSLCEDEIIPYGVRLPNLLSEPSPTYYPEDKRAVSQRISSRLEVFGAGRSRGDIYCTCGERMLSKCRERPHSGCRKYCNTNILKYCPNCFSRCPYPSFLFFRKEF